MNGIPNKPGTSQTISWIVFGIVLASVCSVWSYFVLINPIQFWGVDEEATIMSMAQAINIDYWLSHPGSRPLSQAQFYQPGLWFQLLSWLTYRLAASPLNQSSLELFRATIQNPARFWFGIEIFPILLCISSLTLLFRQARVFGPWILATVLSIYFVSISAIHYGIFMPWNESFSLLLAVGFFTLCHRLLSRAKQGFDWKLTVACGLFGGLLYIHKMNYFVWAVALVPALIVQIWTANWRLKQVAKEIGLYLLSAGAAIYILGSLALGHTGFANMISAHREIFMGTGLYGGGDRTVVKTAVLWQNLKMMAETDLGACATTFILAACLAFVCWKNKNQKVWIKSYLSEAILLLAALAFMFLALLKHYQLQYTVSVAALFPFCVLWFARSGKSKYVPLLIPLIAYPIFTNMVTQFHIRAKDIDNFASVVADEKDFMAMSIESGQDRIWMYRSNGPMFERIFILNFAGLEMILHPEVDRMQGPLYLTSPWNSQVQTAQGPVEIKNLPWRYIITPKASLDGWIDKKIHPWVDDPKVHRTALREHFVFENTAINTTQTDTPSKSE